MKLFTITAVLSFFTCFNSYSQCIKGNCYKGHGTFQWENKDRTSVDGLMVFQMVKVNFSGKMEISIWETLKTVK